MRNGFDLSISRRSAIFSKTAATSALCTGMLHHVFPLTTDRQRSSHASQTPQRGDRFLTGGILMRLARSRSFSCLSFLNRFAWIFGRFLNDSRCFIRLSLGPSKLTLLVKSPYPVFSTLQNLYSRSNLAPRTSIIKTSQGLWARL